MGRMPGAVAQDIFWEPPVRRTTYKSQLMDDRKKNWRASFKLNSNW